MRIGDTGNVINLLIRKWNFLIKKWLYMDEQCVLQSSIPDKLAPFWMSCGFMLKHSYFAVFLCWPRGFSFIRTNYVNLTRLTVLLAKRLRNSVSSQPFFAHDSFWVKDTKSNSVVTGTVSPDALVNAPLGTLARMKITSLDWHDALDFWM